MEVIEDTIKPYYDENLGAVIHSKAQRKRLMKERGVTYSADYPTHKKKSNRKPIKITRDDLRKAEAMVKYNKKID